MGDPPGTIQIQAGVIATMEKGVLMHPALTSMMWIAGPRQYVIDDPYEQAAECAE